MTEGALDEVAAILSSPRPSSSTTAQPPTAAQPKISPQSGSKLTRERANPSDSSYSNLLSSILTDSALTSNPDLLASAPEETNGDEEEDFDLDDYLGQLLAEESKQ